MKTNIFLTLMIACAPQLLWASSPACSSSSSTSDVSRQQALTQELKRVLTQQQSQFNLAAKLVELGADVNITIDENGTTPLMFAAQKETEVFRNGGRARQEAIKFFECALRAGADLEAIDINGKTVRDYAKHTCQSWLREVEMVHAVAQRAHDPVSLKNYLQNVDWQQWDPNFNAMQENATCKHPINYKFNELDTHILMLAAHWNRTEDLRLLLNAPHADIQARNTFDITALHESVKHSYFSDCVQLLVDSGAKINAKDYYGISAMSYACQLGNLSGIDALYAHGAQSKNSLQPTLLRSNKDSDYAVIYYIIAEKPTRQKYETDALFQEALLVWNARMSQFQIDARGLSISSHLNISPQLDDLDKIAHHMNADQIKRCDAVIAKRSQLLSGGNILQLLKERETNPLHSSLLQRRLLQRVHALEAPAANLGEIVSQK